MVAEPIPVPDPCPDSLPDLAHRVAVIVGKYTVEVWTERPAGSLDDELQAIKNSVGFLEGAPVVEVYVKIDGTKYSGYPCNTWFRFTVKHRAVSFLLELMDGSSPRSLLSKYSRAGSCCECDGEPSESGILVTLDDHSVYDTDIKVRRMIFYHSPSRVIRSTETLFAGLIEDYAMEGFDFA